MPLTPYHFGPHATVALPFVKYIDVPVFVLANIAVDIEPGLVMVFNFDYPLHGYCHTLLIGAIVGAVWGATAYPGKRVFQWFMKTLGLPYTAGLIRMIISGILGVWFHVLTDALIYTDIKPFYPIKANPLYGIFSPSEVYLACEISFLSALTLYTIMAIYNKRRNKGKEVSF